MRNDALWNTQGVDHLLGGLIVQSSMPTGYPKIELHSISKQWCLWHEIWSLWELCEFMNCLMSGLKNRMGLREIISTCGDFLLMFSRICLSHLVILLQFLLQMARGIGVSSSSSSPDDSINGGMSFLYGWKHWMEGPQAHDSLAQL